MRCALILRNSSVKACKIMILIIFTIFVSLITFYLKVIIKFRLF